MASARYVSSSSSPFSYDPPSAYRIDEEMQSILWYGKRFCNENREFVAVTWYTRISAIFFLLIMPVLPWKLLGIIRLLIGRKTGAIA